MTSKLLRAAAAALATAAVSAPAAYAATASSGWVPAEAIVAFDSRTSDSAARAAIVAEGGSVQAGREIALLLEACRPYLDVPRVYHARFASDDRAGRAVDALAQREDVRWAQRNHRGQEDTGASAASAAPPAGGLVDDPYFPIQWALENTGQVLPWDSGGPLMAGTPDTDIDWPADLDGGEGTVVAVVDRGVGPHPDYRLWTNGGEIPGNGIDDDGNGWVDDLSGWNVVEDVPEPSYDDDHANGVAGIAGAVAGNGIGIAGVASGAEIMSIRLFSAQEFPIADANTLTVAETFAYAIRNGADVMNNSWGFLTPGVAGDALIHFATECADRAGLVVVWSGGNISAAPHSWPSNYPGLKMLRVGYFTHPGGDIVPQPATVDILAPSYTVMTTVNAGGYRYRGQSSFAAPHVSGTAALIRARYPSLTASQIREAIIRGAEPSPPPNPMADPYHQVYNPTKPRLNASGALAVAEAMARGG